MEYSEFFKTAMGSRDEPFPYQVRVATEGDLPDLIDAPTGAGKTAAVVLAWLWRRHFGPVGPEAVSRRLAYCLPMRVLVEQTRDEIQEWLENLSAADPKSQDVEVHVLMGGEDAADWDIHPEREAVLVGTQDMLLSRAMNRGYGMSRFRWPLPYALLNNDCLWVFDEVQLMGPGVATSAQLAGLRPGLGTFGPSRSIWMSATLDRDWLSTVDHRERARSLTALGLTEDELSEGKIGQRMKAAKVLKEAKIAAPATDKGYGKAVAEFVTKAARPGALTLVVLNTVGRARAVYEALNKVKGGDELILLHSRFRPAEREVILKKVNDKTIPKAGRIIVSTQVIEAGVDLSARVLVTELCPWSSFVQRLGRCHRHGELTEPGEVFWLDLPTEKAAAPYAPESLEAARPHLRELQGEDVSPLALRKFGRERGIKFGRPEGQVIRRRDVLDLFDTTPDLSGGDIDVGRFIRGDDPETDVQVFWRGFDRKVGPKAELAPGGPSCAPRRSGMRSSSSNGSPRRDIRDMCGTNSRMNGGSSVPRTSVPV